MGLAVETIKDMLNFVLKYPSSFVFKLFINLVIFFGAFIIAGGVIVSFESTFPESNIEAPFLPFLSSLLFLNTAHAGEFLLFIFVGFVVILVASLVQAGGFPILVYQAVKKREIYLAEVFRISFDNMFRILVTSILIGLVIIVPILPALIPFMFATSSFFAPESMFNPFAVVLTVGFVLLIIGVLVAAFLSVKLWLAFPILMLERKSPTNSLRASWRATDHHFWSIAATMLLYTLVVILPLTVLNILFRMAGSSIFFLWNIISSIVVGTLSGILSDRKSVV